MRRAVVLLCFAACGDGDALRPDAGSGATDAAADDGGACDGVPIQLRVVNLCAQPVDLYVDGAVLVSAVAPGAVTQYSAAMLRSAIEVRRAGDPLDAQPLAESQPLMARAGDRATIALRGANCTIVPLFEDWGDIPAGFLRVRFVDTLGRDTPTRLFLEQDGGLFHQIAAIDPLGDSGPEGVLVPVAPIDRTSVRAQVGPELSNSAGTPGYQIPTAVLEEGATLFVFNRQLALLFVGADGTPPAIPDGVVRINPSVALLNAVPDLCANGFSHFAVSDADGHPIAAADVHFGLETRIFVRPTQSGHRIVATPLPACNSTEAGGQVSTGPLAAGGRYLLIVFGPAAAMQVLSTLERPPATVQGPSIVFANAATGAPPLDVEDHLAGGLVTTAFSAVPFGMLAPWIPAPTQDHDLVLTERPTVSTSFSASQSAIVVAIGDWAYPIHVAVRLVTHRAQ